MLSGYFVDKASSMNGFASLLRAISSDVDLSPRMVKSVSLNESSTQKPLFTCSPRE